MAATVHKLTIPSSTRFLEDVREFISEHALDAEFSESDIEKLKIAVDECCTNVIEHAYNGEGEHPIDIAVITKPDEFTIRIRDRGKKFDPTKYTEPDLIEYAKTRKSGGFGVHIMRRLMDQVEYSTTGSTNECRLTKFRS
ncbi:MAG: ATP-binding protein [Rhodothermales bacterium]|nr:ATP-binding protein [Rhodothermales bacterium]